MLHPKEIALKEYCEQDGHLPIHSAAQGCTVEVMEFLMDLYPESVKRYTTYMSENLLHIAAASRVDKVAKVRYLCSRYPEVSYKNEIMPNNHNSNSQFQM